MPIGDYYRKLLMPALGASGDPSSAGRAGGYLRPFDAKLRQHLAILETEKQDEEIMRYGRPLSFLERVSSALPQSDEAGVEQVLPALIGLGAGGGLLASARAGGVDPSLSVARTFIGPKAHGYSHRAAEAAEDMAAIEEPRGKIWGATETWQPTSGQPWLQEVADQLEWEDWESRGLHTVLDPQMGERMTVGQMQDFVVNEPLYSAYPHLAKLPARLSIEPYNRAYLGSFDPSSGTLRVQARDPETARQIFAHETQHAVQHFEPGMLGGANPANLATDLTDTQAAHELSRVGINPKEPREVLEGILREYRVRNKRLPQGMSVESFLRSLTSDRPLTAMEQYRLNAGEMLARLTETRLPRSAHYRLNVFPWTEYDFEDIADPMMLGYRGLGERDILTTP